MTSPPTTFSPIDAFNEYAPIGEFPGIWPSTPYRADIMAQNSDNYHMGIAISSIKIISGW